MYFFAFEEKDIQIYVFNTKISMNVCCTVIYKITVKDKHILYKTYCHTKNAQENLYTTYCHAFHYLNVSVVTDQREHYV